jgi:myo-inositol-1(or 4)-monophosphatase
MSETLQQLLDFATQTAYDAGRLTLGYYQTGLRPDTKADSSPVTIADRKAEELIRLRIERRYPQHAIVGEEYGVKESEGGTHRWFIDPIDGTKSFMRGVPLYAVLLGLEIEGQVEVGAAYFPALDEMLAAASGLGCTWNGRPARVSNVASLDQAYALFSDVGLFAKHGRAGAWERIKTATYHRPGWGDAYGYLLVATGRGEIMLDPAMHPWDCGPWPPILGEAGGYFGDWQGKPTIHAGEAMATTQALLPDVLALIEEG